MYRAYLFLFLVVTSFAAKADVLTSMTLHFSMENLRAIERGLETAKNRPDLNIGAYITITDDVLLYCPSGMPRGDLDSGCLLHLLPKSATKDGEMRLSFRKDLVGYLLRTKIKELENALSTQTPGTSNAHIHIGNPLYYEPMRDGTHYFCKPEKRDDKPVWGCYLYIAERLGGTP